MPMETLKGHERNIKFQADDWHAFFSHGAREYDSLSGPMWSIVRFRRKITDDGKDAERYGMTASHFLTGHDLAVQTGRGHVCSNKNELLKRYAQIEHSLLHKENVGQWMVLQE